jgi:hypothetical protein
MNMLTLADLIRRSASERAQVSAFTDISLPHLKITSSPACIADIASSDYTVLSHLQATCKPRAAVCLSSPRPNEQMIGDRGSSVKFKRAPA